MLAIDFDFGYSDFDFEFDSVMFVVIVVKLVGALEKVFDFGVGSDFVVVSVVGCFVVIVGKLVVIFVVEVHERLAHADEGPWLLWED